MEKDEDNHWCSIGSFFLYVLTFSLIDTLCVQGVLKVMFTLTHGHMHTLYVFCDYLETLYILPVERFYRCKQHRSKANLDRCTFLYQSWNIKVKTLLLKTPFMGNNMKASSPQQLPVWCKSFAEVPTDKWTHHAKKENISTSP